MRAQALRSLLLAASLLAAACASPPPPPPAEPPPPEPGSTICERPPRLAPAPADPAIEASFRAFARDWLAKLKEAGDAEDAPGGRRQIRDEFEIELRPTRSELAPWVGILRYCALGVRASEAVSEIFRFQEGEWVY